MEGFINHENIDEDEPSFYHTIDQQQQQQQPEDGEKMECRHDGDDSGIVYPLRVSKHEMNRHVNLLLTESNGIQHYSSIRDFSHLIGKQYTRNEHRHFYCYTCLHDCKLLQEHQKFCKMLKPQRVSYPQGDDTILKFTNIQKQLKAPFVCYVDFECSLKPPG